VQAPATHEVVPLPFKHVVPHVPQFDRLVSTFASQPLFALPSQFANPALHEGVHTPAVQLVLPLAFVQVVPHAPQFEVVFSDTSHPSSALPLQLPNPAVQTIEHVPAAQDGVPLVLLHAVPHAPQFDVFVFVFVSHPLAALASQLPNPALHEATAQVPVAHVAVAFASPHTCPHAPQLVSDLSCVSHPFAALASQLP
jgi:hypothetical protein